MLARQTNAALLSFFCCYWETKAKIALMASIYTWESGSGRISNKRLLSCLAGLFDIIQIPQWHLPEELCHAVLEKKWKWKRKSNGRCFVEQKFVSWITNCCMVFHQYYYHKQMYPCTANYSKWENDFRLNTANLS